MLPFCLRSAWVVIPVTVFYGVGGGEGRGEREREREGRKEGEREEKEKREKRKERRRRSNNSTGQYGGGNLHLGSWADMRCDEYVLLGIGI